MNGYIHSIETLGTVDGPGLRYVVFTSGCPLRCLYCHNPDTWKLNDGKVMTSEEILEDYEKYRPFLKNGGLSITGGEPLVQLDFIIDLFEKAKKRNIHTCLDTSGASFTKDGDRYAKFKKLAKYTDLVMLDIKHIDKDLYKKLTGGDLSETLDFLDFLSKKTNCNIWIRHVIVKGYTYDTTSLYRLGYHIGQYKNISSLDVLPYHSMGVNKYEKLGLEYKLKDMKPMTKESAIKARTIIEAGMRDRLLKHEARY